eukprot:TRINITY_DN2415_c0_g1_i7.p1 TRINITY_DN2415_c0_g1~~TRINITY_DN2415_c0_g1_i7.p1  ORF type:complete len:277 (+),score=63.46 TRINITY_DN2415_c0_g1_i7:64-894(+)
MSASMMMLTAMVAAGISSDKSRGRGDYDHMKEGNHGYEKKDNKYTDDMHHQPPHSRLVINASPASVDMIAISKALEGVVSTIAYPMKVFPLFVCPSTACPDSICPSHDQLTSFGCIVNEYAPSRGSALQADESLLEFLLMASNPDGAQDAMKKIEDAITQGTLSDYSVKELQHTQQAQQQVDADEGRAEHDAEVRHAHDHDDDDDDDDKPPRKLAILIACSVAVVLALLITLIIYCCCCKKTAKQAANDEADIESQTPSEQRAELKNIELQSGPDC